MRAEEGLTMATATKANNKYDIAKIKKDFPILCQKVRGKDLVYLDNAATSQKPQSVINAIEDYYCISNANVHRGVHVLSERATALYEGSRDKARDFIGAEDRSEVVFTRGTTEAINLVAQSYGRTYLKPGDEVVISWLEHHSNIVPWQLLCEQVGAKLRIIPINDQGELVLEEFSKLLNSKTKLVSIGHISNALGTINPVKNITEMAHASGAVVLIDGAQAVPHQKVDVKDIGCDFYAFSAHKMFGPTGIGVLYGKRALLDQMPPYQGGGDMIRSVSFEGTDYNELPYKFEAGTPNISGAIGLGAAIDYLNALGMDNLELHEQRLLEYGTKKLNEVPGLKIIGTSKNKASVFSFILDGIHPHDIGTIVDEQGVAIRTGHHCAQPVMERFQVPATARASLALYNSTQDIDALCAALYKTIEVFK